MGMFMKIVATSLSGLFVIETTCCSDSRGRFERLYCETTLSDLMGSRRIVQINQSCTKSVGAIRGMHFQRAPYAEMKIVRCLKGRVWDVAVDIREGSSTFLHWHAEELSSVNQRMVIIPEGFAHGFQSMEPDSELLYLHTAIHAPSSEGGLKYDDPMLGIAWPLPPAQLSHRDRNHAAIETNFKGITV